jgi:hypothetical protein
MVKIMPIKNDKIDFKLIGDAIEAMKTVIMKYSR